MVQGVRHLVVHRHFIFSEVLRGKDAVFVKRVVAHQQIMEQVALQGRILELLKAVEQKEELRLESVRRTVLIELRQERIFSKVFFNEHGVPAFTNGTGKRGLTNANYAFNRHKMNVLIQKHQGSSPSITRNGIFSSFSSNSTSKSLTVLFVFGSTQSGAISLSGTSTNWRL